MSMDTETSAGEDSAKRVTAAARTASRARGVAGGRLARALAAGVIGALLVPLLVMGFATPAFAAGCGGSDEDDECKNYSLYQLASNASSYFGEKNSPDKDDGLDDRWEAITKSPATGGSLLGYADPEFSLSNIVGWFFAEISGSSQTITYDTLKAADGGDGDDYQGMLDYAHFGAANADLGLDTMSSGIGGEIVSVIGGSIIWGLYALALFVSLLFGLIIILLKMLNPFMWFSEGAKAVNATLGEGMVAGGDTTVANGPLKGLVSWISGWYQLLNSIAWETLVPLFIAFLLLGLILFKKMDRGSAIKKFVVRVVYIGVGLPLIGSMYTGVLDKFDDLGVASAGPTRVVLSTYVDFEGWMMHDRLAIPEGAVIGWNKDQASSDAMMNVRTSALSINKQAHPKAYANMHVSTHRANAGAAWKDGSTSLGKENENDTQSVFMTFGLLGKYITSQTVAASDFESGIKSSITKLDVDSDDKSDWFVNKDTYGDAKDFGHEGDPTPKSHPVISTFDQKGLTSSSPGGNKTTFTTGNSGDGCGFKVMEGDDPAACNLAPLAAYNYLNSGFDASSMTMYSSNNATSGFTRENHMSVSQVGTGPAKFMYWSNAGTILVCLVLLGFWYAIGMLVGSVKRTFSLVTAIPFAALGMLGAISKVIIYSAALILEVIATLFLYSFVSEYLIGIPGIISGPTSDLVTQHGIFGSRTLGGIVVAVLTLISSLLVIGVTFALLRARKVVLQAMDEAVTKLVDKFLETNNAPKPDKGGILPSLAAGAGSGAGLAMGNKIASGLGNKTPKRPDTGKTNGPTNAGGLNGDEKTLEASASRPEIGPGSHPDSDGLDSPAPDGGGGGPGGAGDTRGGSTVVLGRERTDDAPGPYGEDSGNAPELTSSGPLELANSSEDSGGPLELTSGGEDSSVPESTGADHDSGGPLELAGSSPGSSRRDKETAQTLSNHGGLSDLGYDTTPGPRASGPQGRDQDQGAAPTAGTAGPAGASQNGSSVAGTRVTPSGRRPRSDPGTGSRPQSRGTRSLPQADNQQRRVQLPPRFTRIPAPAERQPAHHTPQPTSERQEPQQSGEPPTRAPEPPQSKPLPKPEDSSHDPD
ncbi:hypothetical protein [Streptomyces sp. NRRL F-5053]|uniref:hypothetical protein n=1 Tax=Streptomyces sp. NRRL F-5053 TaxID=1463854 RepID=UPI0004CB498F|nr:hypothetical protein [Streptomyces sp. NRRL F-5053]